MCSNQNLSPGNFPARHERQWHQRSHSSRKEVRRCRELSTGHSNNTMPNDKGGGAGIASGGSDAEHRVARYKEERRRQLASQIASRLSAASSSSDEEDAVSGPNHHHTGAGAFGIGIPFGTVARQHESYSKYRRRRKKEGGAGATTSSSGGTTVATAATTTSSDSRSSTTGRSGSLKRKQRGSKYGLNFRLHDIA